MTNEDNRPGDDPWAEREASFRLYVEPPAVAFFIPGIDDAADAEAQWARFVQGQRPDCRRVYSLAYRNGISEIEVKVGDERMQRRPETGPAAGTSQAAASARWRAGQEAGSWPLSTRAPCSRSGRGPRLASGRTRPWWAPARSSASNTSARPGPMAARHHDRRARHHRPGGGGGRAPAGRCPHYQHRAGSGGGRLLRYACPGLCERARGALPAHRSARSAGLTGYRP